MGRLDNLEAIQKDLDFIYSTVEKTDRRQAAHLYNQLIDHGKSPDGALKAIQDKYLKDK